MRTAHTETRNYKCDECSYAGKTKDDLTTHKMSHAKAFECDVCERKFSRKTLLREHRVLHENPNAYACKICKMNFAQKKTLKVHLEYHAGVKVNYDKRCFGPHGGRIGRNEAGSDYESESDE
jgi:KRAB domain-containing zinc finger protein